MAITIKVRDIKTRTIYNLDPTEDRVWIKTKDGVRVRIHPIILRTMVRIGQRFEGHTITGPREMERI